MKNVITRSTIQKFLRSGLMLSALAAGSSPAFAQNTSIFGPNVYVFDSTMTSASIQAKLISLGNEPQFGINRYAVLFKPGAYSVQAPVGYYESIAGLGELPNAVTINGFLTPNYGSTFPGANVTDTFWRSMENMSFNPVQDKAQNAGPNTLQWGVSQGAPLRRIQINGGLELTDSYCGYASGGFIADSEITGQVFSCSQQQWYSRDSSFGSWAGSVWNMVFSGVIGAPAQHFPSPSYTTLSTTPVSRERPFLYLDGNGSYNVFKPSLRTNVSGVSWSGSGLGVGTSIPISDFFIASPSNTAAEINTALASGKNLILTPGIYQLATSINVTRPNTVVLGLGYATLVPTAGLSALTIAEVDGVQVAGLIVDAGPRTSAVLFQVGDPAGRNVSHQANPTTISDVFFRIGGAAAGSATTSLKIDSDNVILDDIWAWRADHGNGVGWTENTADHGLIVDANNVTATGLAVEHYQKNQVIWNGNGGETIFYQSELPYDPPSQAAWMNGTVNGYSSYAVSNSVTTHKAYGLGVYSFFDLNINIADESAITVPNAAGVTVTDSVSVFLTGSGSITHVVNSTGATAMQGNTTIYLPSYGGAACTADCLAVVSSGLVYNRGTQLFSGTLTVTNTGTTALSGPYSVELSDLTAGVTLTNGTTVGGVPAVQVIGSGVSLAPGQKVSTAISFSNPSKTVVSYTPVVVNQ